MTSNELSKYKLLFPNASEIYVPKKAPAVLKKFVSKKLLKEIDKDINIAIDKCLVVLSNLASTYFDENNKWKCLHSSILHDQTKNDNDNTYIYKKVINALIEGSKEKGSIIEVDESYQINKQSKKYRITDTYLKGGLNTYFIKSDCVVKRRSNLILNQIKEGMKNPIIRNLLEVYSKIQLPTVDEIKEEAKRLIAEGYKTKKGKTLTMLNNNSKSRWKNIEERTFVEDNIELFLFLTSRGYMIPTEGDEKSGGRVVDSFALMPSWIRKLIKIDGQPIKESDYSSLHPNIANKIYLGSGNTITHKKVAKKLSIEVKEAKVEHLSFFNKRVDDMVKSPLFSYYEKNEPLMLINCISDKKKNGYKSTTKKLFKMEVDIMRDVIIKLNNVGVYVVYVYDALYCSDDEFELVSLVMNDVAEDYDINTNV